VPKLFIFLNIFFAFITDGNVDGLYGTLSLFLGQREYTEEEGKNTAVAISLNLK
jgi:hypothetical protein